MLAGNRKVDRRLRPDRCVGENPEPGHNQHAKIHYSAADATMTATGHLTVIELRFHYVALAICWPPLSNP